MRSALISGLAFTTAFVPWRYLGAAREGDAVSLFELDALSGRVRGEDRVVPIDAKYREALDRSPEFRTMRELSALYHAVEARERGAETFLRCRDLRTRNFDTRFGELELRLDADGGIIGRDWRV